MAKSPGTLSSRRARRVAEKRRNDARRPTSRFAVAIITNFFSEEQSKIVKIVLNCVKRGDFFANAAFRPTKIGVPLSSRPFFSNNPSISLRRRLSSSNFNLRSFFSTIKTPRRRASPPLPLTLPCFPIKYLSSVVDRRAPPFLDVDRRSFLAPLTPFPSDVLRP